MQVFTAGHSNRAADQLLALLREAEIACVADVRRFPQSRRFPQHSRARLEPALRGAGLDYAFLGDALGGRLELEPGADRARNGAWREPSLRAFADALDSPAVQAGLAELERLARAAPTAFLCAERDWRSCHRQIIADSLVARGWEVVHLAAPGEREVHRLHPSARSERGRLSYPALL
ncbi:MAG TPA: DUF488 domain-containing protein [Myxococcota bacterium]|nr:DUF488 domain-containing protein [Myxococcota bacterium]